MKLAYILIIAFLMSVICSCGSAKKTHTLNKVSVADIGSLKTDSISVVKNCLTNTFDLSHEDIEIIHVVYDTESDTPKVAKKTTYRKIRKSDIRKEEIRDSVALQISDTTTEIQVRDSVQSVKTQEGALTNLATEMKELAWVICKLIVLIIILRFILVRRK